MAGTGRRGAARRNSQGARAGAPSSAMTSSPNRSRIATRVRARTGTGASPNGIGWPTAGRASTGARQPRSESQSASTGLRRSRPFLDRKDPELCPSRSFGRPRPPRVRPDPAHGALDAPDRREATTGRRRPPRDDFDLSGVIDRGGDARLHGKERGRHVAQKPFALPSPALERALAARANRTRAVLVQPERDQEASMAIWTLVDQH